MVYTAVSGFLFLRFFAPAVLSPMRFGINDDNVLIAVVAAAVNNILISLQTQPAHITTKVFARS